MNVFEKVPRIFWIYAFLGTLAFLILLRWKYQDQVKKGNNFIQFWKTAKRPRFVIFFGSEPNAPILNALVGTEHFQTMYFIDELNLNRESPKIQTYQVDETLTYVSVPTWDEFDSPARIGVQAGNMLADMFTTAGGVKSTAQFDLRFIAVEQFIFDLKDPIYENRARILTAFFDTLKARLLFENKLFQYNMIAVQNSDQDTIAKFRNLYNELLLYLNDKTNYQKYFNYAPTQVDIVGQGAHSKNVVELLNSFIS